jgi:transposase
MFIKKSWCVRNGKKYMTFQIAESYRPGKGKNPRTKILATITRLPEHIRQKIALLLKSESIVIPDTSSFFKHSFVLGPVLFLYLFMKKIGIINCLNIIPPKARILLIGVILNRILEPRSKLGSVSWIKRTAFPFLFGIEKEKLVVNKVYKAMDILYRRLKDVLNKFFEQNKGKTILLLYDITSIFFEGKNPEKLAKYGYSRDNRPNNKQIILSLCLNEEKLPVYFDILEGNTQDKKTVIPLIKKLRQTFNLDKAIFIGDRGMVTVENLNFLEKEGIDYIVALTHKQARKIIIEKGIQLDLFAKESPVTVLIDEDEKIRKRYVLCGSEYRKQRDELALQHLLEKARKNLEVVAKMVESGKLKDPIKIIKRAQKKLTESGGEEFFDFEYEEGRLKIIEKTETIKKAKLLCGYYLLQTTVENLKDSEIEEHYKGLKFVEEAFRQLKDLVDIRPIFHWKDRRVKTHIFLCILAQTVVNKIKDILKLKGWLKEENSFSNFLDIFYQINLGIFEIEGKELKIINQLTSVHKELLNLFEIDEKIFCNFTKAKKKVRSSLT